MLKMLFGNNAEREVDVDQLAEAMAADSHTLLDVREQDEWEEARIAGAIHMPMSNLYEQAKNLPKEKPVYVVCHSGARSLYALNVLESEGFTEPRSVAGGIVAWARSGKPLTR